MSSVKKLRKMFSSCHERETKKKFWVPRRIQTSDVRILPSDALPLSHEIIFPLSHARDKTKNISLGAVLLMMGHFSCECLYIKTNVITATNHTKVKCYKKPLRTQRQNMLTTWGAGKCHRPIRDWFKFASDWSVSGHKSFSDQSTIIFQFRVLIRRRLPSRLFFLVVQARIFWLQSWNV